MPHVELIFYTLPYVRRPYMKARITPNFCRCALDSLPLAGHSNTVTFSKLIRSTTIQYWRTGVLWKKHWRTLKKSRTQFYVPRHSTEIPFCVCHTVLYPTRSRQEWLQSPEYWCTVIRIQIKFYTQHLRQYSVHCTTGSVPSTPVLHLYSVRSNHYRTYRMPVLL